MAVIGIREVSIAFGGPPVLDHARFSIERNRSTVEFYDYRRTRSEVGVVRAF